MKPQTIAVFRVLGLPAGQPRPRACIRGRRAAVYDPGTADRFKNQIALAAIRHRPPEPLEGPLGVALTFFYPTPRRLHEATRGDRRLYAPKKPDIDNAAKAVLDSLTDLRFWQDDALVVDLHSRKFYSTDITAPGVTVEIWRIAAKEVAP